MRRNTDRALHLDRLIQKIRLGEQVDEEPYIALIKRLAVKDKLDLTRRSCSLTSTKD